MNRPLSVVIGEVLEQACLKPEQHCELCGKLSDTCPYGPNFAEICFECGMKDEALSEKNIGIKLFGDPE